MEGQRKWEELNMDCLANVFGRLGMEPLLLDIPFVCKSWYKGTLNPKCWEKLIFPEMNPNLIFSDPFIHRLMEKYQADKLKGEIQLDEYQDEYFPVTSNMKLTDQFEVYENFPVTAFMKFVVNRSNRSASVVSLPSCCTVEALTYVADECPALKILLLPYGVPPDLVLKIPSLVIKWTHLEMLRLGSSINMQEILAQINSHCKNFVGLFVTRANVGNDEASAIVTSVPKIKYLSLRNASLERENLITILKGCKELVQLDVRDCEGFEDDDQEIIKLASHIAKFACEGSRISSTVLDDYLYEYFCFRPNRDGGADHAGD